MGYVLVSKDIEIKVHGHDCIPDALVPSQKVLDACNEISDSWKNIENPRVFLSSRRKVKANARKFLNSKFKLHKVFYKNLSTNLDLKILSNIDDVDTCLKLCGMTGAHISPYLLPVSFCATDSTGCMVVENVTYIKDDYYLENMKVSYKGIHLQHIVSDITESSYVHELAHTQTLDQKGSIREYYNTEVISIFLELLNIYESGNKELAHLEDAIRLSELFNDLNVLDFYRTGDIDLTQDELLSHGKYSTSIAKAYSLFIEYVNGTPSLRKYILRCIQNIFDGNLQLEELLDEFEITFESSFENQKLLKYFCR